MREPVQVIDRIRMNARLQLLRRRCIILPMATQKHRHTHTNAFTNRCVVNKNASCVWFVRDGSRSHPFHIQFCAFNFHSVVGLFDSQQSQHESQEDKLNTTDRICIVIHERCTNTHIYDEPGMKCWTFYSHRHTRIHTHTRRIFRLSYVFVCWENVEMWVWVYLCGVHWIQTNYSHYIDLFPRIIFRPYIWKRRRKK